MQTNLELKAYELLQDVYSMLAQNAPVYPGALIFAEDKPAVEVIREFLEEVRIAHSQHQSEPANVYSRRPHRSA